MGEQFKTGIRHICDACRYSRDGFLAAWQDEVAFRQIIIIATIGIPLSIILGDTWIERLLLALPIAICVIVELFNTAIENVVDLISPENHPLAKKAKDMGSAAQFTAQIWLCATWLYYFMG